MTKPPPFADGRERKPVIITVHYFSGDHDDRGFVIQFHYDWNKGFWLQTVPASPDNDGGRRFETAASALESIDLIDCQLWLSETIAV